MNPDEEDLAGDVIRGAEEIALHIYGDRGQSRKIYHLHATSRIPFFKIGSLICLRRSVFRKWIEDQEQRHSGEKTHEERHSRETAKEDA